jgi:hypothetical protein
MSFKTFPAWLKGGIIGVILLLISLVLVFTAGLWGDVGMFFLLPYSLWAESLSRLVSPLSFAYMKLFKLESFGYSILSPFFVALTIVYTFIVGAVVGWIYGKIKSAKTV